MAVSVTLVTHNARDDVGACLESLLAQTVRPEHVRVIDNASADGTADDVASRFADVELHRNGRNVGYSAAQNRGIALARQEGAKYVFFLTPDVVLEPDHIEHLVKALNATPAAASAGGKLLRTDGEILDGAGISASRARHFRDRGQGEQDDGGYDGDDGVFGPCGAAVLHRIEALDDVAVGGEVLDESFFAYKEDIDLAWRLRLRGWTLLYVPEARARHRRAAPYTTVEPAGRRSLREVRLDRKESSPLVRRLSARNQLLLLVKNEHPRVLVSPDVLRIIARHVGLLGYHLAFEPETLLAYGGFLLRLPGALWRRFRFARKARYAEIRAWFR